MSRTLERIRKEVRSLSLEEREALAEELTESLYSTAPEIEAAWDEEVKRRMDAFDRGDDPGTTMEAIRASISKRFKWQS
jgi:putative addiction module component (TIGR02574 family)